jgi:hypothetical protein
MTRIRRKTGALSAEFACTLYVLFFLILFPMLNYATLGIRAFFLWFAANQAVMAASKAKTYLRTVYVPISPPNTAFYGAFATAQSRAAQIKAAFSGISWTTTNSNPNVEIILEPINPASGLSTQTYSYGNNTAPLGLGNAPDPSQYVVSCRVVIQGYIAPLIAVPWFNVPGLSGPVAVTVASQAQYENVAGLQI